MTSTTIKQYWARFLLYAVVPLLSATFNLLKLWTSTNCRAFDLNDDAVHTFVNLFVTHNIIREGQFPFINLWNNFGTPLIGDALTYPWAFHAQTYWFAEPMTAMAINRFVLGFLTVLVLIIYFRHSMTRFSAMISALLVMYTPGFIWHFAHHHYQACILWIVIILIAQRRLNANITPINFGLLCASFIALLLNTSLNVVAFFLPFVIMNQCIIAKKNRLTLLALLFTAIASGFLFLWPDTAYLFHAMTNSMRVDQIVTFKHMDENAQFSWIAIALAIAAFMLTRHQEKHHTQRWQALLLGALPIFVTAILIDNETIWQNIPLLRSVDISRFLWIAAIFIGIGVGTTLDHIRQWQPPYGYKVAVVIGIITVGWSMFYSGYEILGYEKINICHPKYSHHFSPRDTEVFPLRGFIERIPKQSRVAFEDKIWYGYDIKVNRDYLLGASGRSMFMHQPFSEYLLEERLIHVDQNPFAYHFQAPWNATKLHSLGVRYVMQKYANPQLEQRGWKLRGYLPEVYYLYENRFPTSLAYLTNNNKNYRSIINPDDIAIKGNNVHIKLPTINQPMTLTTTFVALKDWKAFVDEKPRPLYHTKDHMIKIDLQPGDQHAVLEFKPVKTHDFILNMLLALLLPVIVFVCINKKRL